MSQIVIVRFCIHLECLWLRKPLFRCHFVGHGLLLVSDLFTNGFVEVGVYLLCTVENIVLGGSFFFGHGFRNRAFVGEYFETTEIQEFVDAGGELLHGESVLGFHQVFNVIEEARDSTLQTAYLLFVEIVLGNGDIRFQDASVG